MKCAVGLLGLLSGPCQADCLVSMYRQLVLSDPALLGSEAQVRAAQERVVQARAGLLPNLTFNSSLSRSQFDDHVNQHVSNRLFFSRQTGLQLNQPLFRPVAWYTWRQSRVQTEAAALQRDAAHTELVQRLVTAYFDVLTARSELRQFEAQKKATAEQLSVARRSFQVGTVSVTDVREAEAKFDTIAAQAAAADMDVQAKESLLSLLVGQPTQVDHVPAEAEVPKLALADLDQWLARAEDNSPQLNQAKRNLVAARLEASKAQAGALPTIDLSLGGQNNYASASTLTSLPQGGQSWQSGVNISVPLYAGGSIQAKLREALALEDKAQTEVEQARRALGATVRQAFFASLGAIAQFKGLQTAERSGETAVKANQRGYQVGMRINADVLYAESQLYQTRRDKARACYQAWVNFLRLKAVAGVVSEQDLAEVDQDLSPPLAYTPAPVVNPMVGRVTMSSKQMP